MGKRKRMDGNESDQARPAWDETRPVEPPSRMPTGARRLKKGDRVEFDIGEGVDGPPYAMNVKLIDDD